MRRLIGLIGIFVFTGGCGDHTGPELATCVLEPEPRRSQGQALTISLTLGSICELVPADVEMFKLVPSNESAEYLAVIQSGSRTPGSSVSLQLEVSAEGAAENEPSSLAMPALPRIGAEAEELEQASRAELLFRANARQALINAKPLRHEHTSSGGLDRSRTSKISKAQPQVVVGDTVIFTNTVAADLSVDCQGIHDITSVVRAVGENFGVVEDIEVAGLVTPAQYASLLKVLDDIVYPVDTVYFGSPADLDDNGIVWVMFSPVVNRVTPRDSPTRISGFFNPSDLSDSSTCAGSNEAELLYVLAADPTGRFSDPVPSIFATKRAVTVTAHELEHLIVAQQRVTIGNGTFADLEEPWLSEGLAHTAETAVGFMSAGLYPQENLNFFALTSDRHVFDAHHFANLRRAGFYLMDTNGTPALGNESGFDPGGVSSLQMRGFSWLLLRWFSDQFSPAEGGFLGGPAEEMLFRDLAVGGATRARGIANLERVARIVGGPGNWEDLLARYALSPLADDFAEAVPSSAQFTSFQLRDTFAGLNREKGDDDPFTQPFPLIRSEIDLSFETNVTESFDLKASTARYFLLESEAGHPLIRLTLTTTHGERVPSSAMLQLVLLRTR
jgi:hypothetical protein